jgi:hypothetical protein
MGMTRYQTMTEAELESLLADPRCTPAERMLIAARIGRGELKVVADEDDMLLPN